MVLPWVTDSRSPACRQGLLGCPFFDSDSNEFFFAVDERYSLNLKQSPFVTLRRPMAKTNQQIIAKENSNQILSFRKSHNDIFVPSSLLQGFMYESDNDTPGKNVFNKLAFNGNPKYPGQYIAVYSNRSKNGLTIDLLNEIELQSGQTALDIFDRHELDLPFAAKQIKSFSGDSFAVSSNQIAHLYSYSNDTFIKAQEFVSPEADYISCIDVCRHDLEMSILLGKSKKLIVCNHNSRFNSEFDLSNNFSNCSYSTHPSLLILSGDANIIELQDLRGNFSNFAISDQNVPFHNIQALISHKSDANLIAVSCQTDIFDPSSSADLITSEIRIYDIRYPKESAIRIATDSPISQFVSFGSYADNEHDYLIGLNSEFTPWYWELRHSKSNYEFSDGILSLTDCSELSAFDNYSLSEDRKFIGYSVNSSYNHSNTLLLTRLANDGELEYSLLSDKFVPVMPEIILDDEKSGEILDFEFLSSLDHDQNTKSSVSISLASNQKHEENKNFGPMFQSTFHLDFYWDEMKEKLIKNGNQ